MTHNLKHISLISPRILGLFYYAGFDLILIITTLLATLVLYAAIGFNFGVETSPTTRVKELAH